VGGPRGQKPRILQVFWGSSYFSANRQAPTPQTCWKSVFRCFTLSHQSSCQNFERKYLFEQKSIISTRWLITFQALFLAITCRTTRLVAFPSLYGFSSASCTFQALQRLTNTTVGSLDLELWSTSKFFQFPLLDPHIFLHETAQIEYYRTDPVFDYSRPRRSAKMCSKKLHWMRTAFFCIYCGFCRNFSGQKHKYGFSWNISNGKLYFCHFQSLLCAFLDLGMFSLAF